MSFYVSEKCKQLWKKNFHHFVPLIYLNTCAKFHEQKINGSEIKHGGSQIVPRSEELLKSPLELGLSLFAPI